MISPVLKKSSVLRKRAITFADLIKASFGSNNRSVNKYLEEEEKREKESLKKVINNFYDILALFLPLF